MGGLAHRVLPPTRSRLGLTGRGSRALPSALPSNPSLLVRAWSTSVSGWSSGVCTHHSEPLRLAVHRVHQDGSREKCRERRRGFFLLVSVLIEVTLTSNQSLVAQTVNNPPAMQKNQGQSLGQEDPLEKRMATHSSTLAWRISWTEKPGGLQSMGWQRVGHG